jgi:hypothetical protein
MESGTEVLSAARSGAGRSLMRQVLICNFIYVHEPRLSAVEADA